MTDTGFATDVITGDGQVPLDPLRQRFHDPDITSVMIVGYTITRTEVEYDRPDTWYWGMNDLHAQPYKDGTMSDLRWDGWFDLHAIDLVRKKPTPPIPEDTHRKWLAAGVVQRNLPVFMYDHVMTKLNDGEAPTAVEFPLELLHDRYGYVEKGPYWTNTIAKLIAGAMWVLEPALHRHQSGDGPQPTLGIYGVDMAADSEYEAQRRCCEFYIGQAMGAGFRVELPVQTDLLSSAEIYGWPSPLRMKFEERQGFLRERAQGLSQQAAQLSHQLGEVHKQSAAVDGALSELNYFLTRHMAPHVDSSQRVTT